jgi:putative phage-type endonuclease
MTTDTIGHAVVVADTAELDRPTWLELRRQGLGGSDISAIVGLSPYRTALSVWLEKTGVYVPEDEPSEAMEWGNLLEPVVADEFSRRSGIPTEPVHKMLAHPEHAWMLADLDRLIPPHGDVPVAGVYEGKTASPWIRKSWGTDDNPLVPDHAEIQTNHYLAVTGLPWAAVAVLIGGQQLLWRRIERNEELIGRIVALESEFWARVVNLDPPPPTEMDSKLLGEVWAPTPESSITLGDDVLVLLDERRTVQQAKKVAEGRISEIDAAVKLALADREFGLNEDGEVVCSWKQVEASERKATVVAAHRRFWTPKTKEESA